MNHYYISPIPTRQLTTKMKTIFLLVGIAFLFSCNQNTSNNPIKYVDPKIGSVHGRWFFFTPGALPFGMAKLAPHTNAYNSIGSWLPCGYDDRHNSIEGFGQFHEFQIGGLVFMPAEGQLLTTPGTLDEPEKGYRSRFIKDDEYVEPGYYSVVLKDYNIKAELTATERVGFQRYTFPETKEAHLIIDIGHKQGESSDITEAFIEKVSDNEFEGYIVSYPEYVKICDPGKRVKMFFAITVSKSPIATGSFVDDMIKEGEVFSKGVNNGMYLTFTMMKDEILEVQTGLSYTSVENARLNLETEASGITFDEVHDTALKKWNLMLSRIKVEGGQEVDKTKFYTGLYHALLGRGLASDVNGMYPRNDGNIGQIPLNEHGKPSYNHYNTDGIWGGFWNLGQLWALAYPDFLSEYMQSNLDFYLETGWLHDGVASGAHSNGVQTNFNGLMLAATYNCGIRDFDIELAYEAARKNELDYRNRPFGSGKYDLNYFVNNGYIHSYDTTISNGWIFNFGASHTLEFCFSSYAVAQFAKALNKKEDYEKLMNQAQSYKLLFDKETKFIRPRNKDGSFIENFDPMEPWVGFQEGNAFQYTWYVPHDPAGMIELVGLERYNERLEMMFFEARKSLFGGGKEIDSFSGLQKLYNHGNQPCLFNSFLFNFSGKPWLSQKWSRLICQEFYGTEPLHGYGFGQDEDQGQLGAWYVMSAIGLFDVAGHANANPVFQLGSPQFEKITIELDPKYYKGKKLTIETVNNSPENVYIQSASLNGKSFEESWILRENLMKGAKLKLVMGPNPNTERGVGLIPPSMSNEK